jgi:hypothetical protein
VAVLLICIVSFSFTFFTSRIPKVVSVGREAVGTQLHRLLIVMEKQQRGVAAVPSSFSEAIIEHPQQRELRHHK